MSAFETFHEAVRTFALGRIGAASRVMATVAGEHELYAHSARWLAEHAEGRLPGPYDDASAFAAYRTGVPSGRLRDAGSAALARLLIERRPARMLDVGAGDGVVLARAFAEGVTPAQLTLVEPSSDLLRRAATAVSDRVTAVRFNGTVQGFAERAPPLPPWDLVHASLSLQNLDTEERARVLPFLASRGLSLLLVEFDCLRPDGDALDADRIRWTHDRYLIGMDEHTGSPLGAEQEERAKQGFLMPMLFGGFLTGRSAPNYEQPIAAWIDELMAAGFTDVTERARVPHWWSDGVIVLASRPA